jgi:hypothetical protein
MIFGSVSPKKSIEVPGPGRYPLPSTLANNNIYMGIKLNSLLTAKKNDTPGPGYYTIYQT